MLSHSVVSNSLQPHGLQPARLLCPWGFYRQDYWSGLPRPPPGDLPNPGIKPNSPALQADSLPSEPLNKQIFLQRTNGIQQLSSPKPDPQLERHFIFDKVAMGGGKRIFFQEIISHINWIWENILYMTLTLQCTSINHLLR